MLVQRATPYVRDDGRRAIAPDVASRV